MEKNKHGKSLAFLLILFFLIVILLGAFVGKRLVQLAKASESLETELTVQSTEEGVNAKAPDFGGLAGGYSFPTATTFYLPTFTATAQPTEAPQNTATAQPTEAPQNTATAQPTEAPQNTATAQPTEAPQNTATAQPTEQTTITSEETKTPPPSQNEVATQTRNPQDIFGGPGTETPSSGAILPSETQPGVMQASTATSTTQAEVALTPAPSIPPTVGPGGSPERQIATGMIIGLIGLLFFGLYFWNLLWIKR